jgi:hypothetical protein
MGANDRRTVSAITFSSFVKSFNFSGSEKCFSIKRVVISPEINSGCDKQVQRNVYSARNMLQRFVCNNNRNRIRVAPQYLVIYQIKNTSQNSNPKLREVNPRFFKTQKNHSRNYTHQQSLSRAKTNSG